MRIECEMADGMATGTGFFFRALDDGQKHVPVIVTNKHVVKGARRGWFHLTKRDAEGAPLVAQHTRIELPDFEKRWISHPQSDVDLCVMPIGPLLEEAGKAGHQFFFIMLDRTLIPSQTELDDWSCPVSVDG